MINNKKSSIKLLIITFISVILSGCSYSNESATSLIQDNTENTSIIKETINNTTEAQLITEANTINNTELITESESYISTTIENKTPLSVTLGEYAGSPIKWKILDAEEDKTLLISRQILDYKPFNESTVADATDWEYSSIRYWLNNDFFNSVFSSDEQNAIQASIV